MRLALALVVLVAALVIAGCGGSPEVSSGENLAVGKELFVTGNPGVATPSCGACHVLEAAGTSGQIGPNLDHGFGPTRAQGFELSTIEQVVREQMEIPGVPTDVALNNVDGQSRIAMPSRDDYGFSEAQADDIAFFVTACSGLNFLDPAHPETQAAIDLCSGLPDVETGPRPPQPEE